MQAFFCLDTKNIKPALVFDLYVATLFHELTAHADIIHHRLPPDLKGFTGFNPINPFNPKNQGSGFHRTDNEF